MPLKRLVSDDEKLRLLTCTPSGPARLQVKLLLLVSESNTTCWPALAVKVYFCCWPGCPMLPSTRAPRVSAEVTSLTGCRLMRQVDGPVL